METLRNMAADAERILVPKSRDATNCVQEFTSQTGIEVPDTVWESEYARSGGRSFRLVPGGDMPGQIAAGWGDLAICSTELVEESGFRTKIDTCRIGAPICGFSVLALEEVADDWQRFLEQGASRYPTLARELPSTFPRYLGLIAAGKDLPVVPQTVPISGKAEVTMRDNGIGAVTDRIVSGNTVRKIGGREVFRLAIIFTEVIIRRQDAKAYQSAA